MKTPFAFILLAGLSALGSGCYYDNAEELYPTPTACDTAALISYTGYVRNLMETSCGSTNNACHTAAGASGIPLDTYIATVASANSTLLPAVRHENGASPMPKGGGKLDDCSIAKLEKWVATGTPEN